MGEVIELAMITLKSGATITIKDYEDEINYDRITSFFDKILRNLKDRSLKPGDVRGGYFQYGHKVILMDEIASIMVNEDLYARKTALAAPSDEIKFKAMAVVASKVYDFQKDGHITELIALNEHINEDDEEEDFLIHPIYIP